MQVSVVTSFDMMPIGLIRYRDGRRASVFSVRGHYTIGWLGQQMIGIDSRLAAIGYPDLVFRHMKVMNLFGMTNVGLFVAT